MAKKRRFIKILYWGIEGSGKTTIVDTLYRLTKGHKMDIEPSEEYNRMMFANPPRRALSIFYDKIYCDKCIFYSTKQKNVYYHVYTATSPTEFSPVLKKAFKGTDGVIFVVDSQIQFFDDNIESLKELINSSEGNLMKEIPLIIMLNKLDLPNIIKEEDLKQELKRLNLWYESKNKFSIMNPTIFKTCALFEQRSNIYRSFMECASRIDEILLK